MTLTISYNISRDALTKKNYNNATVTYINEQKSEKTKIEEQNEVISKILAKMFLDRMAK